MASSSSLRKDADVAEYEGVARAEEGEVEVEMQVSGVHLMGVAVATLSFGVCSAWWVLLPVFTSSGVEESLGMSSTECQSASSLTFLIVGVTSPGWGTISDRIGRKAPLAWSLAIGIVGCFAEAMSRDIFDYFIARGILGVALAGVVQTALPLLLETCPPSKRGKYNALSQASFSLLGQSLLALISMRLGDHRWRTMSATAAVPAALALAFLSRVPESPPFLAGKGREEEARESLKRLARRSDTQALERIETMAFPTRPSAATNSPPFYSTLRPSLRNETLALIHCWCCAVVLYYAMSFDGGALNNVLLGLVDLPAYYSAAIAVDHPRLGRVGAQSLFFSICAGAHLGLLVFEDPLVIRLAARFGVTAAFAAVWVLGPEVFPTSVRAGGLGLCNCVGKSMGFAAPLFGLISPIPQHAISAIYASTAAAATYFVIRETRNKPLEAVMIEDK